MKKCPICYLVQILAGIGALNWGLVAIMNLDLVAKVLGVGTMPAKIVYILVGVSGLITLVTLIKSCPCGCKKD
jgi:uncharacterized membrane protein YuzA (DUF378 family)